MEDKAISAVAQVDHGPLPQLIDSARSYAEAGVSAGTRRVYGSSWRSWISWCASAGVEPLPAEAAHVALYLTARAPTTAVATLARDLAAIAAAHKARGLPPPAHPDLDRVWAGIKRTHGRPPRKKRALTIVDLRRVLARLPASLAGARDRALLLVGYAGALRRSELANLSLDLGVGRGPWALFVSDGLEIHVGRAKGDQEGRGTIIAVPFGRRDCPVGALKAWLAAAHITSGAVFRGIDRHGRMRPGAMSDRAIAERIKAACAAAGIDADDIGGHSLRRGMITDAARSGAAPDLIQRHARHARWDTTRGYVEEAERFKRNATRKIGL